MLKRGSSSFLWLLVMTCPAWGQWESGSDGSDGAFVPVASALVDLGLAASLCDCDGGGALDDPCRWDCPSPVAGQGVYDAHQWAVVYKYTTIDVPAGATITFKQHRSGAPVVWLASGDVTISGEVNLDGAAGCSNCVIIPSFSEPGPGGFAGGQKGHSGVDSLSVGFGPGSSPGVATNNSGWTGMGGSASYSRTAPAHGCSGVQWTNGATYGNASVIPLIGGSGGTAAGNLTSLGGGAGGGAVLLASTTQVTLSPTGAITARGGNGAGSHPDAGGAGSGGTIRIRTPALTAASGSQLLVPGGTFAPNQGCGGASVGRIRVEAVTATLAGTVTGTPAFSASSSPSVVFPASAPTLQAVTFCGEAGSTDPGGGILTTDVDLSVTGACTIDIEATGIPVGTSVSVRVIPARGNVITATSTPLADAGGGLLTATASVTFPSGRSEVQLRANW